MSMRKFLLATTAAAVVLTLTGSGCLPRPISLNYLPPEVHHRHRPAPNHRGRRENQGSKKGQIEGHGGGDRQNPPKKAGREAHARRAFAAQPG